MLVASCFERTDAVLERGRTLDVEPNARLEAASVQCPQAET